MSLLNREAARKGLRFHVAVVEYSKHRKARLNMERDTPDSPSSSNTDRFGRDATIGLSIPLPADLFANSPLRASDAALNRRVLPRSRLSNVILPEWGTAPPQSVA
jgi:hypothetical protein